MKATNKIMILKLFLALSFLYLFLPSDTLAAWNPAGEKGEVTYDVKPQEKLIHVRLTYHITNLDSETVNHGYYTGWPAYIHANATNIRLQNSYSGISQQGQFKVIKVNFIKQLSYGQTESFIVEYDLPITSINQAEFTAYADTENAVVKIIIPRGYYTSIWLDSGYTKEETSYTTTYIYSGQRGMKEFAARIELARETKYLKVSSSAQMANKRVNVIVNYWEGEESIARNLLNIAVKSLPVLEKIIGVPFPPKYSILISRSTSASIGGFAGENKGEEGIFMPFESIYVNEVLLHELSHYWAMLPPFKDKWMHEGQADLYAYLALRNLGFAEEANKMLEMENKNYNSKKNSIDLSLHEWNNLGVMSDTDEEVTGFLYTKSFLFMLTLHDKLGLDNIQKSNREVFSTGRTVNWLEYLNILEKVSGQDLKKLFSAWVLSRKFTENYAQWLSIYASYQELDSLISKDKQADGIQLVERENQTVSDLIVAGFFPEARDKAQNTRLLYEKWKSAWNVYIEAEKTISRFKNGLGIGPVEKELTAAKELLTSGQYDMVSSSVNSALKLYRQWQDAEKIYQDAYKMISTSAGNEGISRVNEEIKTARELLIAGRYNLVQSRVDSALKLLEQWRSAEKVYREAYDAISRYDGNTGISVVQKELEGGRQMLIAGQYEEVASKIDSVLKLLGLWQEAEKTYRDAYNTISQHDRVAGISRVSEELKAAQDYLLAGQYSSANDGVKSALQLYEQWKNADKIYKEAFQSVSPHEGNSGILAVNREMKKAQELLAAGQYQEVSSQVQSALKIFQEWKEVYKDFQNIKVLVSESGSSPSIGIVQSELKSTSENLEKGELKSTSAGILATRQLFDKWKKSYETYNEAKRSLSAAREEGRTRGLDSAESLLVEGEDLFLAGIFEESTAKFSNSIARSSQAASPSRTLVKFAALLAALLLIAVSLFIIRKRAKRAAI